MKLNLTRTLVTLALVALVLLCAHFGALSPGAAIALLALAYFAASFAYAPRTSALLLGAVTPQFLFDLESNMQQITENEYLRMVKELWWTRIGRRIPSKNKRERIAWMLATAQIRSQGLGGNIEIDDLVATSAEYVNLNAGAGLKLTRDKLEDNDGAGLDLAGKWSSDIGAYMAYWPQKQIVRAILNGGNTNGSANGYDAVPFFSTAHPVNPVDPGLASITFANDFTGAASGVYPGALPIDDAVHGGYDGTVNMAIINLAKAIAYIRGIVKMPNGEDPRYLKPVTILAPPRMTARVQQLTNAKFIAQVAGSGAGGSADISMLVRNWGLVDPVEVLELSAGQTYTMDDGTVVTGSDTTWYLACEEITSSQLGALVYVDREPFSIAYYSGFGGAGAFDSQLARQREFEWLCQGRNVTGYGHPYMLYRFQAT